MNQTPHFLAAMSARLPVQWATYPGDCRGILNEGPKGPNTLGEPLYPVTADYDADAGTTRVGFSYIAPDLVTWPVPTATPFGIGLVKP